MRGDINVSSHQQFVVSQNDQQVNHSKGITTSIMMSQGVKQTKAGVLRQRGESARHACGGFSDVGGN